MPGRPPAFGHVAKIDGGEGGPAQAAAGQWTGRLKGDRRGTLSGKNL